MDQGQQGLNLLRGQRAKIADLIPNGQTFMVGVTVNAPGLVIDFACFGLDSQGKLSDERYMTFFNQPMTPCGGVGSVTPPGDTTGFSIDLGRLPATIERLTITAAIDGAGTMSAIQSGYVRLLDGSREAARFSFTGADFAEERALMLLEIYRKDGIWRLCALGQGFNGGLAALVRHFGGEVAAGDEAPAKLSLEKKVELHAPQLLSLAKKASISLEKKRLTHVMARVGLVLDASGSMTAQYRKGRVQELVDRILPLAVHFDDDGELDCWIFADRCMELPAATLSNVNGYIAREAPWAGKYFSSSPIGGVNDEPVAINDVIRKYRDTRIPAYVIFISDGGVHKNREIEALIREASKLPIFWQFVGIGGRNYGILEKLDTLSRRFVDNCNFFALDDLHDISESELYDRLLNEFPLWLEQARRKGIVA
ncbi:vWA domain-containing protein [Methylocaldum szegediense]|uniref:vWA domain-containing protein n=1 Tax=Methylocaldum szegediense TaxID=73780 RepID=UPI00192E316C|nr:VWA domain-containing protein [Methylocaldum szegediense]